MDAPKKAIEKALHEFASGDLSENAKKLFKELDYESQRTMNGLNLTLQTASFPPSISKTIKVSTPNER